MGPEFRKLHTDKGLRLIYAFIITAIVIYTIIFWYLQNVPTKTEPVPYSVETGEYGLPVVTFAFYPPVSVELESIGGTPKILGFAPSTERNDIWLLTYDAGDAGTYIIVSETRAVVIDVVNGHILGDAPVAFSSEQDYDFSQPQWIWEANRIRIETNEYPVDDITLPPKP